MIAKFDSYKKFEVPALYVCNPGCTIQDGLLTNVSGVLNNVSDLEIIPTFNAPSGLNFRCHKKFKNSDVEIKTSTGSFSDGAGKPVASLSQNISFIQSGSGDPSPSNIRAITGYTGATIRNDPKYSGDIYWNQLLYPAESEYWDGESGVTTSFEDGVITFSSTTAGNGLKPTSDHLMSVTQGHVYFIRVNVNVPQPMELLVGTPSSVGVRFTTVFQEQHIDTWHELNHVKKCAQSSSGTNFYIYPSSASGTYEGIQAKNLQVFDLTAMFGDAIADEVYNMDRAAAKVWFDNLFPNNYYDRNTGVTTCVSAVSNLPYDEVAVSWQTEAGTVYGGALNANTGVLTVNMVGYDMGDMTWYYGPDTDPGHERFYTPVHLPGIKGAPDSGSVANAACSCFKISTGNATFAHSEDNILAATSATPGQCYVYIYCSSYTDRESFTSAVSGQTLVLELETPQTYQLTPAEVATFAGQNNIWSSANVSIQIKYISDTDINNDIHLYNSLKNRKLIYADGIGFFVITDVQKGYEKKESYKDVKAESCEVELRKTNVPYIEDGTYPFYTGNPNSPGMIERLLSVSPLWTLGTMDVSVRNRYRTFEDVDFSKNILGFMLEDLQDAYECIFVFDIVDRIINIYDQSNYVHTTSIHITKDDLITTMDIDESSDDLYTALRVTGDEDLSINAVNPIGTGVIYNFNYYLDWMTPSLRRKVSAWQSLVDSYKDTYYNLQLSRYANLTSRNGLDAELDMLQTQLTMYTRCKENIVASASDEDIAAYNEVITSVGGVPIPETSQYMWIMYADDNIGTNMSADPHDKGYIGLAWDKSTAVGGLDPADYTWSTFRNGEVFSRTVGGETKYTWIVYADSVVSGMSNDPDGKVYIGVAIDKDSSTKSTDYLAYSWSLIDSGGIGVNEVLSTIISLVEATASEYESVSAQRDTLQETIEAQDLQVAAIHDAVDMNSYFTTPEMDELSNYIVEGTYTDEFITVTESMTDSERFAQMKTLYDRSILQLEKVSQPTQEYTIDTQNFIFVKDFLPWTEQLETGCLINVEIEDDDVAALFLTSFEVNYEDKSLSMTFGNRYNRFDPKALFEKALGSIEKSANTLTYVKDTIYPIKNGEFNEMKEALDTSRTLTKNAVMSSDNEQVIIDDTGYTGRRVLPDGTIDKKQIKINGRNIVFTDDEWETCKTAIGELILSGGISAYGVNAEVLLGDMIIGNELHIINEDGEDMFQVMSDRVVSTVSGTLDANYYTKTYLDNNYYTKDATDNNIETAVASQVEQTASNITANFVSKEAYNESMNDINGQFTTINSYIDMSADGIVLGKSNTNINLLITNSVIQIRDGQNVITSWSTDAFQSPKEVAIPKGEGRLILGDFAFIPRENGSLDFTWIGG